MNSAFVTVDWAGQPVRIEHQWIAPERTSAPLVVFLHEGEDIRHDPKVKQG